MWKRYLLIIFCFAFTTAFGQKRPLDHSVYDAWESIRGVKISKDGSRVLFSVTPQHGDARLIITDSSGKRLWDIPRGENAVFLSNSQGVLFDIKPFQSEIREAKIAKKKSEEMPKDTLAFLRTGSEKLIKWADVSKYKVPEDGAAYLGFLTPIKKEQSEVSDSASGDGSKQKRNAYTLHLWNVAEGTENTIQNVHDFFFDPSGEKVVFTRKINGTCSDSAGLYLVELSSWRTKHLSSGQGTYSNITFDKSGEQLAFTAEKSEEKDLLKPYSLYYYNFADEADSAAVVVTKAIAGMPPKWNVSGNGTVRFSDNGEKLYFGVAPIPRVRDTSLVEFEVAKVDIWHWKDDYLQTQQLVDLKKDRTKSYTAVLHLNRMDQIVPLGSLEIPDIQMTEDANGEWVLGSTNLGSRISSQWEGRGKLDFCLISTLDGQKVPVASGVYGYPFLSPSGDRVVWFDMEAQRWIVYNVSDKKTTTLRTRKHIPFGDEDNDEPTFSRSYGIAGWAPDGSALYIYDKYDIWEFDLDRNRSRNVTGGVGRSQDLTFRYVRLESEPSIRRYQNAQIVHPDSTWLLSAFDHNSKENGWYSLDPSRKGSLNEYTVGPFQYHQIKADGDKKLFVYTKENYKLPPDVYISSDFKNEIRMSNINPQQKNYNWGNAELVHWDTPKGFRATGILYKPEDFDEGKKYPMIVYFYEKLSDGLYSYIPPAPTPSRLNISYFVSNGYLVFAPDIEYQIGHPGRSAEEFINSGVEYLAQHSWVDSEHIGIQGQSWGGYQVAHLITRTDMYAAAWSGAPVVNMTSAYGGIRWSSGRNRQFQYERTQSRIGKNLWEGLDLYIENSPLFHLEDVTTPVVIMANDADGAVPWYQGIEMFTALRRLQKPVWLLNYNGDAHNLMLRQNRKDIQRREQQFFDHFLKGAPAPVWIEFGIPATLKGIDWGFELVQ